MKLMSNPFESLRRYVVNPLTGEACAYGQRVLCDLADYGKDIVFDLLGIPRESRLVANWSTGADDSMMIPRLLLEHDLPIWCSLQNGCHEVVVSRDGICGREAEGPDEDWEQYLQVLADMRKEPRRSRGKSRPRQGSRMVHAFSGRSA